MITTKIVVAGAAALAFLAIGTPDTRAQGPAPFDLAGHPAAGNEFTGDAQSLSRLKGTKDFRAIDSLSEQIEAKWSARSDPAAYYTLAEEIIDTIWSVPTSPRDDAANAQRWKLLHKYSLRAASHDDVPIGLARVFYGYITTEDLLEQASGELSPTQWADTRRQRADMWLKEWKLLASLGDPTFDPSAASLKASNLRDKLLLTKAGSDEQKAGLAELNGLFRQITDGSSLHIVRLSFQEAATTHLGWYYSAGARNDGELVQLMNTYGVDPANQSKIMGRIAK